MEVAVSSCVSLESRQWFSQECRACLQKSENASYFYKLFEAWPTVCPGMGLTVAADFGRVCHVQIEDGDGFTDVICQNCYLHLSNAMKFIAYVQSNDEILRKRDVANNSDWPKPILVDKSLTEFAPNVEIKEEILSDDEMILGDTYEGLIGEIKIEPEELVMPTHVIINNTELNGLPENHQEDMRNIQVDESLLVVKQEPKSDEEEEMNPTDVPLDCLLCSKSFKHISGLKAHVIAMHSYKSVKRKTSNASSPNKKPHKYVCSTCQRTFTTSTDLMVHETCHNKSVCYSCNQSFDSFKLLTKHRKRCKAAKADVVKPRTLEDALRHQEDTKTETPENNQHTCNQCGEQFSDIFYLQVHKEIHKTDPIVCNSKGDSDSENVSNIRSDNAKDYLEKMLQATETDSINKQDEVRDLEKLLKSSTDYENNENNTSNFEDYNSENISREIDKDIVSESLQRLLQSDDSMDSIHSADKIKSKEKQIKTKVLSKIKETIDIENKKEMLNNDKLDIQNDIDNFKLSAQETPSLSLDDDENNLNKDPLDIILQANVSADEIMNETDNKEKCHMLNSENNFVSEHKDAEIQSGVGDGEIRAELLEKIEVNNFEGAS